MTRICIFPNDPMKSYVKKGAIKQRYYNPDNFFDEVHMISFTKNDADPAEIQSVVGDAKLEIHNVGKIDILRKKDDLKNIVNIIKKINPNVIRAYNCRMEGWFAAKSSSKLNIPFFLSLHTEFGYNTNVLRKTDFKKYLGVKYIQTFIEPYVLRQADKITVVYNVLVPYVIKRGGKTPEVLYNKIDLARFASGTKRDDLPTPLVLSVGQLIREKNHQCVIKAMKNLDAHLLIVGGGVDANRLSQLVKDMRLEDKVSFISSISHNKLQDYYKSASVFVSPIGPELKGLPMPVMEAMASGTPVVMTRQEISDGLEDAVLFCRPTPDDFSSNIKKVLEDQKTSSKLAMNGIEKSKDFDGKKIERREAAIYAELIN